ncbi:MAG: type I phosphomannose isomerase catalytic subunit, partial [Chthoniobacterales bacterium]
MEHAPVAPILFQPIFQERVWGGRKLADAFGKPFPPQKSIGEAWEIVDREEAQSVVRQGVYRGKTLHELWCNERREIFGDHLPDAPRFPILAKLLDARETLSLQVHPTAEVAAELGGESKTETWYVASAEPGAGLFVGLKAGATRDGFERALHEGTVIDLLHRLDVKAGDALLVPSGRLHAIGAGNLIVEIQQNSDTTYRVFDWDRPGTDGQPRKLHLAEAMRAIDFGDFEPRLVRQEGELLVRCPEFTLEKWDLAEPRAALDRAAFAIFFCLGGVLKMSGVEMCAGDFFLVPATVGDTP